MSRSRPNILFIFADDWGWGDLGCYGHEELQTPYLDGLASQGTRYTRFHVTSPVCSPSRCSVITGQYPARHRIHGHLARYDLNRQREMPNWLDVTVRSLPGSCGTPGIARPITANGIWAVGAASTGTRTRRS